jgi:hypothetical protein
MFSASATWSTEMPASAHHHQTSRIPTNRAILCHPFDQLVKPLGLGHAPGGVRASIEAGAVVDGTIGMPSLASG